MRERRAEVSGGHICSVDGEDNITSPERRATSRMRGQSTDGCGCSRKGQSPLPQGIRLMQCTGRWDHLPTPWQGGMQVVDCPGERPVRENLTPGVGRGCWRRAARFWRCTPRRGTAGPGSSTISRTAPAPYFIRNRSGVRETACSEGRSGNWGDPTAPVVEVDSCGSMPWYKATPKSRVVQRESERAIVLMIRATTKRRGGKGPHFGDARAARDGSGHG